MHVLSCMFCKVTQINPFHLALFHSYGRTYVSLKQIINIAQPWNMHCSLHESQYACSHQNLSKISESKNSI